MVRKVLGWVGLALALVVLGCASALALGARPPNWLETLIAESRPPIVVGLVHSQTGPLKISEESLIEAELLAIEEINAGGGVAGRLLKAEIADGRSDASTFASQARRLLEREKAEVLVGGWTAECRKAMLAVVEEKKGLLIFPANFEGIESSPNIIYSGGAANQVILPAVRWLVDALNARKFYVVGTEEVASRCVSELAKDAVKAAGCETVGESYLPLAGGDARAIVEAIEKAKPDAVLNILVGDSNLSFFSALKRAGLTPDKLPVLSYNISEDELRRFPPGDMTGQYAAWSYFQSVDRPENAEFVRKFKAHFPGQDRVVSDPMVAAYNGLMIWAHAARSANDVRPRFVLEQLERHSFAGPESVVTIDPESRIAWRPCFVGKVRADGQFDVVWSIDKPIHPENYVATRTKAQWLELVEGLKARWGGRWSSSETVHPGPTPPVR